MTDEPFRYVEAMANRREYVETQLASASPVVALSFAGGILFVTLAPEKQKLFEIYDRIALGALGHPGDVERLRMTAIEIAGTEGFTRSPADVSLRRLVNFSFSPLLKNAYEQVYGPVFLARLLFAELGIRPELDYFVRVEFDGSLQTSGTGDKRQTFGVVGGTQTASDLMTSFLAKKTTGDLPLDTAFQVAMETWAVGSLVAKENLRELPAESALGDYLKSELESKATESAILGSGVVGKQTYRALGDEEIRKWLGKVGKRK